MISKRQVIFGAAAASILPVTARAASVVSVPLQFYHERHPVILVMLDGKGPFPFHVASGSAINVIDPDLAESLQLKTVNKIRHFLMGNETVSAGSIDKARDVECLAVTIGDGYALNRRVFSTNLSTSPAQQAFSDRHANEPNYPRGSLGAEIFLETPCILDNGAAELRFYPGSRPDIAGFTPLRSQIEGAYPNSSVTITIDVWLGGERLSSGIDTAGTAELYLTSKYVRQHGLYTKFSNFVDEPLDKADPSKGTQRTVRMKNFRIGTVVFDEINVGLGDPDRADHLSELGIKAVVSGGLLKQLDLAFTADRRILIKPNRWFTPTSGAYVPESFDP